MRRVKIKNIKQLMIAGQSSNPARIFAPVGHRYSYPWCMEEALPLNRTIELKNDGSWVKDDRLFLVGEWMIEKDVDATEDQLQATGEGCLRSTVKRYALHPGKIESKNDGDHHYVSFLQLVGLYGLNIKECFLWDSESTEMCVGHRWDDFEHHLYPNYNGNYTLPSKEKTPMS